MKEKKGESGFVVSAGLSVWPFCGCWNASVYGSDAGSSLQHQTKYVWAVCSHALWRSSYVWNRRLECRKLFSDGTICNGGTAASGYIFSVKI